MNVQTNVSIPSEWRYELDKIARNESVEKNKNIVYGDLVRNALKQVYKLK